MTDTACGYYVSIGYFGRVGDRWMLFATEGDYIDYLKQETTQA